MSTNLPPAMPLGSVCVRCKQKIEKLTDVERLTFKSDYKQTTVQLCKPCFAVAREIFDLYMRCVELVEEKADDV